MKTVREHKFISFCIIAALIVVIGVLAGAARTGKRDMDKQAESIAEAVSERALQCYVIENAYPESLAYLEENYGLTVNKKEFQVIYTPFAENLPPDIRVVYRGDRK